MTLLGSAEGGRAQGQVRPFKGGVELVPVDLSVITQNGDPVLDLRPGEIKVAVEGRPRALKSLQLFSAAMPTTGSPAVSALPPAVHSNHSQSVGRVVILAIAHEQIRMGNEMLVLKAADVFIGRLSPVDRVAIVILPQGRVLVDLTTNHALARRKLPFAVGHATTRIPAGGLLDVLALRELISGLGDVDARKTVIYVSEGLAAAEGPGVAASFRDLERAAGTVRAQVYTIQPHSFPFDASLRSTSELGSNYEARLMSRADGLADLATMTGGDFFRLAGRADWVFDRILRETSAYYVATFEADEADGTGQERRIAVSVTRAKVIVRARRSFIVPKAKPGL